MRKRTLDYQMAVDALRAGKRNDGTRSLDATTLLAGHYSDDQMSRHPDLPPWSRNEAGDPHIIELEYRGTPIFRWMPDSFRIHDIPDRHLTRTTFDRISTYTPFRMFTQGSYIFVTGKTTWLNRQFCHGYTGTTVYYGSGARLSTEGFLWLEELNALEFFQNIPRIAGDHARALTYGRPMHGWDERVVPLESMLVRIAMEYDTRYGKPSLPLLKGLLELTGDWPMYQRVLPSLAPDIYNVLWRPAKTEAQKVAQFSAQLEGKHDVLAGHQWRGPVKHPRELYQNLKYRLEKGLRLLARITKVKK